MNGDGCDLQSYFKVAARLGDVDAQQELGFCYANGKGCKKDLREAAKWYRAAVSPSHSFVLVLRLITAPP
jgi:TPR repeat protein